MVYKLKQSKILIIKRIMQEQSLTYAAKLSEQKKGRAPSWTEVELGLFNYYVIKEGIQCHDHRKSNGYFPKMAELIQTKIRRQCTRKFQLVFKPTQKNSKQVITTEQYVRKLILQNGKLNDEKMNHELEVCQEALSLRFQDQKLVEKKMQPIRKYIDKIKFKILEEAKEQEKPQIKTESAPQKSSQQIPQLIAEEESSLLSSNHESMEHFLGEGFEREGSGPGKFQHEDDYYFQ